MRTLKIELDKILDLISCAVDYSFERDVLFSSFAKMIGNKLTSEEIEIHSKSIMDLEGYGEEDCEQIKERLTAFKNKYCA